MGGRKNGGREGRREGGKDGGREGRREGWREGGREGRKEGGREGGMIVMLSPSFLMQVNASPSMAFTTTNDRIMKASLIHDVINIVMSPSGFPE